jgi:hypothetical protein
MVVGRELMQQGPKPIWEQCAIESKQDGTPMFLKTPNLIESFRLRSFPQIISSKSVVFQLILVVLSYLGRVNSLVKHEITKTFIHDKIKYLIVQGSMP